MAFLLCCGSWSLDEARRCTIYARSTPFWRFTYIRKVSYPPKFHSAPRNRNSHLMTPRTIHSTCRIICIFLLSFYYFISTLQNSTATSVANQTLYLLEAADSSTLRCATTCLRIGTDNTPNRQWSSRPTNLVSAKCNITVLRH